MKAHVTANVTSSENVDSHANFSIAARRQCDYHRKKVKRDHEADEQISIPIMASILGSDPYVR